MTSELGLVAAAAGVGFGHAVLPDHWVPIAVMARGERMPLRRVFRLSSLAGLAHVGVSIVLGGLILLVGLSFRRQVEDAQRTIVGTLLVLTGLAFAALEVTGRGHSHHHEHGDHHHGERDHGHHHGPPHEHATAGAHHAQGQPRGRVAALARIAVPFGAAASPDLTILPVFLAATVAGAGTATITLCTFALVTVGTMVTLTLVASAGALSLRVGWLDSFGNAITAAVLVLIGVLVLSGVL